MTSLPAIIEQALKDHVVKRGSRDSGEQLREGRDKPKSRRRI
jgi:hypothetical protein